MPTDLKPGCPRDSSLILWRYGELESDEQAMREHLDHCAACSAKLAELDTTIDAYTALPLDAPGPERYQLMLGQASRSTRATRPRSVGWQHWALAAVLVLTFGAGTIASRWLLPTALTTASPGEEADNLPTRLTGDLTTGSAHERLQAVISAAVLATPREAIWSTLVEVLANDPSVNVRLAVVDALRGHPVSPAQSLLLIDAFGEQDVPILRKAIIELYVALDIRAAEQLLRTVATNDPERSVREHAHWALEHLS